MKTSDSPKARDTHHEPERFFATRTELEKQFRSPALLQALLDAGWIKIVRPGKRGRATLYCYQSALRAAERIRSGQLPGV